MFGFKTKNSYYYLSNQDHLISGGKLGDKWHRYTKAEILIGSKAVIYLEDGRVLKTGVVEQYL